MTTICVFLVDLRSRITQTRPAFSFVVRSLITCLGPQALQRNWRISKRPGCYRHQGIKRNVGSIQP